MSSADFTIYTLVLEFSLMWSYLLWGEFNAFSAANLCHSQYFHFSFHQVPITAGWTEAVWYERFLPNTSTHELTSVIRWEQVNLPCATICVGDCSYLDAQRASCTRMKWSALIAEPCPIHEWNTVLPTCTHTQIYTKMHTQLRKLYMFNSLIEFWTFL